MYVYLAPKILFLHLLFPLFNIYVNISKYTNIYMAYIFCIVLFTCINSFHNLVLCIYFCIFKCVFKNIYTCINVHININITCVFE